MRARGRRVAARIGFVAIVTLLATAGLAGAAGQQDAFHITYTIERSVPGRVTLRGTVQNVGRLDAYDVYVTAEAIDANGRRLARGVSYVDAVVRAREQATFTVNVPLTGSAATYEVRVSSARYGPAVQGP